MSKIADNLEKLFSLEGKVCLLTGAAGGIGVALAKGLAGAGAMVALADISVGGLEALEREVRAEGCVARGYEMDVTDTNSVNEAVRRVVDDHGRIDVLVNCAGINKREGFLDVEEATYDRIMDINLKGVFRVTQAVAPHMMRQMGGSIINIGSHNTGAVLGGVSVYAATKSGILAFTRSMAVEWAKYNIRANCISPGHILTALTQVTWDHPERSAYLRERIAMRRPGMPEEIVGLCVLLASDASGYISGSEYRIDGGCLCGGSPWPYDTQY